MECSSSSASIARPLPFVIRSPAPTVGPQMLRSIRDAPMYPKNRPLRPIIDSRLWLPASENGSTASEPWVSITSCRRLAISASASSHVIALELARPLRSDPAERVQQPLGAVHAVEEAVDLRAQLAGGVRVGGVAAELHRDGPAAPAVPSAVVDGDRPAARVGAVVVAGAVDRARAHGEMLGRPAGRQVCDDATQVRPGGGESGVERQFVDLVEGEPADGVGLEVDRRRRMARRPRRPRSCRSSRWPGRTRTRRGARDARDAPTSSDASRSAPSIGVSPRSSAPPAHDQVPPSWANADRFCSMSRGGRRRRQRRDHEHHAGRAVDPPADVPVAAPHEPVARSSFHHRPQRDAPSPVSQPARSQTAGRAPAVRKDRGAGAV